MPIRSFTVVTVCLNAADTIRLTLESVKRQASGLVQHLIIDGMSSDGTLGIVREYPEVTLVSGKDRGVYDAMDKASRFIKGDAVIFLNAGDAFFDNGVCEAVARCFNTTDADIVFGNLLPYYVRPTDSHDHPAFTAGATLDLGFMRNRRDLYDQSIHHQATFYRRWVLKRCTYACAVEHATGEYNLLLNAVMKHGARVKHIPATVTRFSLGGISTRDFAAEWERYTAARAALRELYCPEREGIRITSDDEFHCQDQSLYMNTPKQSFLKRVVKRSFLFKVYERLARSLANRVVNTSLPEMRGVVGVALDGTKRDILRDVELHTRASLAEVNHQIGRLRADMEARQQQTQSDVLQVVGDIPHRLTECVAALEARHQQAQSDVLQAVGDIPHRLTECVAALEARHQQAQSDVRESVGDMLNRLSQCEGEVSRLTHAVDDSARRVESALGPRIDAVAGTIGESLASIMTQVRDLDSKVTHYGTWIEKLSSRIQESDARVATIASDIMAYDAAHRRDIDTLGFRLNLTRELLGHLCCKAQQGSTFDDSGFTVYSQWDEDGKLEFLINRCRPVSRTFIEIGVGDYSEANTRYLAARGWSGLLIEADKEAVDKLRADGVSWRYSITLRNEFVTAENISGIIGSAGLGGDIGVLSIDIDGVDYWVWRAISIVRPCIVVCEYNSLFGASRALTVPYDPHFQRFAKHGSGIYAGASLQALQVLAESKGYTCVGCNSGGNNAFFVRTDVFQESGLTAPENPFRSACFREARGPDGTLTFEAPDAALADLADMPIWDVAAWRSVRLGDVLSTAEMRS